MQGKRLFLTAAAALFIWALPAFSDGPETSVETLLKEFYELEDAEEPRELDTNDDGHDDYLARTNTDGKKMMEVLDYNHDGELDDFYFYSDGILKRRAVDTNFDQRIDLWVYIRGGVYISRYVRDADFDGVFEQKKEFERSEQKKEEGGAELQGKGQQDGETDE
jgi:hypothetical protein